MATVKTPAGETWNLGDLAGTWKFASFYRGADEKPGTFLIKYHRSEAAARKGHWDSAVMRTYWTYAGYAAIQREA